MPFNLLLLPLVGGYIFITRWNRTRFSTARHTGERLLFHAAAAGVVYLVLAFLVTRVFLLNFPELHRVWSHEVPFPYVGTSLLALVLACLAILPANRLFKLDREVSRVIRHWGDHLEILIERALAENRQISLTLKSGKVYIGFALENFNPAFDRKYITLLPATSGYRDPVDHTIVFTTFYTDVYQSLAAAQRTDLKPSDFTIIIPVGEVQSASLFDWYAYDAFNSDAEDASAAAPATAPSSATPDILPPAVPALHIAEVTIPPDAVPSAPDVLDPAAEALAKPAESADA